MIVKKYVEMLGRKSAIRELFDYGAARAKEVGYENVFDYSLGNPSVAVPKAFNEALAALALSGEDLAVHGYSSSLGIFRCVMQLPSRCASALHCLMKQNIFL